MEIKHLDPKTLVPHPQNPRTGHAVDKILTSIKEFGFTNPILIQKGTNRIIAGHGRWKASLQGGVREIPAIEIEITDQKAKALMIADNRINQDSSWDKDILKSLVKELHGDGYDATLTGLNFDDVLRMSVGIKADEDEVIEPPDKPVAKIGDLFILGKHRLMCGDATSTDQFNYLMQDKTADLIFTDPPYNVDYKGDGKKTSKKILNDNQSKEAFRIFLEKSFNLITKHSSDEASFYCCYASKNHIDFEGAVNVAGWEVRNQIIWVKTLASMGWGNYRWKHEPILYSAKKNGSANFYGSRDQYTEWSETLTDEALLKKMKSLIEKEERDGSSTIWRIKRDANYDHPTQKPVQISRLAILNSSKTGDIVLDPFAGSGSTLIAAEESGRICYAMELDPAYCDVIIERFCRVSKLKKEEIYGQLNG